MLRMPANRVSAAFIHLLVGCIIVSIIAVVVFFVWYPGLVAYASGVGPIFLMLALVDSLLGPFITLIIFDLQKRELQRDLLVVVLIQIIALFYGIWVLFSVRPVFIVFNTGRFDVVYANEFSQERIEFLKSTKFGGLPILGPRVIGARLPSDPQKANEIINSAIAGEDDVQYMPEFYLGYHEIANSAGRQARDLKELYRLNISESVQVDELTKHFLSKSDNVGYLPLKGKINDLTVIIDRTSGKLLGYSRLKPLSYSYGAESIDLKKYFE